MNGVRSSRVPKRPRRSGRKPRGWDLALPPLSAGPKAMHEALQHCCSQVRPPRSALGTLRRTSLARAAAAFPAMIMESRAAGEHRWKAQKRALRLTRRDSSLRARLRCFCLALTSEK